MVCGIMLCARAPYPHTVRRRRGDQFGTQEYFMNEHGETPDNQYASDSYSGAPAAYAKILHSQAGAELRFAANVANRYSRF